MTEARYYARDDDIEDTGYDAGPIEVAAEVIQYDVDEEDEGEITPTPPAKQAPSRKTAKKSRKR